MLCVLKSIPKFVCGASDRQMSGWTWEELMARVRLGRKTSLKKEWRNVRADAKVEAVP